MKFLATLFSGATLVTMLMTGALAPPAVASEFVTEDTVTYDDHYNTLPWVGADAVSPVVTWSRFEDGPGGGYTAFNVYYQRLVDGAPSGPQVNVSLGGTQDFASMTSGDYIVYSEYVDSTFEAGRVMLYQISTGIRQVVDSADQLDYVGIHGEDIVWTEGEIGSMQIMYRSISMMDALTPSILIRSDVDAFGFPRIGERFAVWDEINAGEWSIRGWDLQSQQVINIAIDAAVDERLPATSGSWVVYMRRAESDFNARVILRNLDTSEERYVADNMVPTQWPSIDGDFVSWNSAAEFQYDIFVYHIPTEVSFRVTTDEFNQTYSSIFGNLVVYVDQRIGNGTEDIFVSRFPTSFGCMGERGNVDDDDFGAVNVSDLTYLVAILFQGGDDPASWEEANVDGSADGNVNVSDLTYLIAVLFQGGDPPPPCEPAGDPIPPDLVGNWDLVSAELNGSPIPIDYLLEWDPGTVAAQYTFTADGAYVYEELDASEDPTWREDGQFGIAGGHVLAVLRQINGGSVPAESAVLEHELNGSQMSLVFVENGNLIRFNLSRQ